MIQGRVSKQRPSRLYLSALDSGVVFEWSERGTINQKENDNGFRVRICIE
jgi:hypothetical protein